MSTETGKSSTESEAVSGLDYEETELTLGLGLGLPGGGGGGPRSEPERKRGFSETVDLTLGGSAVAPRGGDLTANSLVGRAPNPSKPPAAKAQVVGWPPVRSFRKNALKSCTYVKVAVDGAPYLRKVDLETYSSYEQLLLALEEMFSCFKISTVLTERKLVDLVNGTEYVPTYEDKDGDWMLVGDVPWKMFVASCKRLRLMKSSEAVNLAPRAPQGSADVCAYPFAIPSYMSGSGMSPMRPPNGDVGVDGMLSVIAHELAELSTNPLINAWYAGEDPTAPTEIGDLCEGVYGTGGGGGYTGEVATDGSGRRWNVNGRNGRRFLVQWVWSPVIKACRGPNALD